MSEISLASLLGEIEKLKAEIDSLKIEKADLEILLETTTEHATIIENELSLKNEQEQKILRALRREMEVGRRIQADFLPEELPEYTGWQLATYFKPSREVGGDFYDIFSLPGNLVGLAIADVCDKGVGAALFMALTRSLLRILAQQASARLPYTSSLVGARLLVEAPAPGSEAAFNIIPARTAEILNSVRLANDYITANHSRANMFATLFFGALDLETGTLYFVNGGHDAPVIGNSKGIKARLKGTGPAVGMIPGAEYRIGRAQLDPGDFLVAYTDGVTEARNNDKVLFTEARLLQVLEEIVGRETGLNATAILGLIEKAVDIHVAGAASSDDTTMLAVKRSL